MADMPRTERIDFRATSDPALHESAELGPLMRAVPDEVLPIAQEVLRPKWVPAEASDEDELFGASIGETKAFAALALSRRLKVIGVRAAA